MSILERLTTEPVCIHSMKDMNTGNRYCNFLTNSIGRIHPVDNAFCNLTCIKDGPYNGKIIDKELEKTFILESVSKNNPFFAINQKFIQKVLKTYTLPVDIIIPDEYPIILENLKFLYDINGFNDLLLTGSAITANAKRPLKDFDIVLWFDTLEDYLNNDIQNKLPEYINNIKVDYFIIIGSKDLSLSSLFFCCLSPKYNKLYKSKWFELNLTSIPKNLEIIDAKCEYFDQVMTEMFINNPNKLIKSSCCNR